MTTVSLPHKPGGKPSLRGRKLPSERHISALLGFWWVAASLVPAFAASFSHRMSDHYRHHRVGAAELLKGLYYISGHSRLILFIPDDTMHTWLNARCKVVVFTSDPVRPQTHGLCPP